MTKAERQTRYEAGVEAEEIAANYLSALGYDERERRARMNGGEIDLIVEDEDTLVFVEVKLRKAISAGSEAVTLRQQNRIRAGLRSWLAIHDQEGQLLSSKAIRCDVVLVAPGHDPVHIPNAFPAAIDAGGI